MRYVLALIALVLGGPAVAEPWAALARPGAVALMRHADAPGTGDPAGFALGNCATQRNLGARGRDQARATGAAIRASGVAIAGVYASEWCRAAETAELMAIGPVTPLPMLNSFYDDRAAGPGQTAALRAWLAARRDPGALVLVTHQVNITALTGRPASSGEAIILTVAADGTVTVLAEVP